ncbi:MAG TPA: hypothetical protein VEA59_02035 [Patescibacteria group bacterium]|nr:hypothetical protein [Patescibacteria group bacterium]
MKKKILLVFSILAICFLFLAYALWEPNPASTTVMWSFTRPYKKQSDTKVSWLVLETRIELKAQSYDRTSNALGNDWLAKLSVNNPKVENVTTDRYEMIVMYREDVLDIADIPVELEGLKNLLKLELKLEIEMKEDSRHVLTKQDCESVEPLFRCNTSVIYLPKKYGYDLEAIRRTPGIRYVFTLESEPDYWLVSKGHYFSWREIMRSIWPYVRHAC